MRHNTAARSCTVVVSIAMACHAYAAPTALARDAFAIGITPRSLVAVGAHAMTISILRNLDSAQALRRDLEASRQRVAMVNEALVTLWQALAQRPEDDALLARQSEAIRELEAARHKLASVEDALFEAAVHDLSPARVSHLQTWRENSGRKVPCEFRILNRYPDEWNMLEAALIAERRALWLERPLESAHNYILQEARSHIEVVEATTRLDRYLADTELVFVSFKSNNKSSD